MRWPSHCWDPEPTQLTRDYSVAARLYFRFPATGTIDDARRRRCLRNACSRTNRAAAAPNTARQPSRRSERVRRTDREVASDRALRMERRVEWFSAACIGAPIEGSTAVKQ